jgi:hypothetical protein
MRSLITALSLSLLAPAAFADVQPHGEPVAPAAPAAQPQPHGEPVAPSPDWATGPQAPATTAVPLKPAAPALIAIVLDDSTQRCKPMVKRTMVPSLPQQLSARIALAGCIADARMQPLQLIDSQESILAIEDAVAPAFALLDNVMDVGDASVKIVALRTKADLYTQMGSRMSTTVPAPVGNTPEAMALRDTRKQIVDGMIQPWRDRGREMHQAIVDLGRGHPELQRNPVAQTAIRDSERQLAIPVATRE